MPRSNTCASRSATPSATDEKLQHTFNLLVNVGNRYLRITLFMPALSAARHDPHARAYYHHLFETRGLKKTQAVCAVTRKLLHPIHAMLKTNTPFDSSRFYTPSETTA